MQRVSQLLVLLPKPLDFLQQTCLLISVLETVPLPLNAPLSVVITRQSLVVAVLGGRGCRALRVNAAKVLVEVLLSRKALTGVALAALVGAVEGLLGAAVLSVNFALVAEEAAGVGEARELLL